MSLPAPPPPIELDETVRWRSMACGNAATCRATPCDLRCSRCQMTRYCSAECQVKHWPEHKAFCKLAVKHGLSAKWFDPAVSIADPRVAEFRALLAKDKGKPFVDTCLVCERTQVRCVRLKCCGASVCANEENYPLMSKSRAYCARSHGRYTSCGVHHDLRHASEGEPVDWRSCKTCLLSDNGQVCSQSRFNWLPPKVAFDEVDECVGCQKPFLGWLTGSTVSNDGTYCTECRPMLGGFGMTAFEMTPEMMDRIMNMQLPGDKPKKKK